VENRPVTLRRLTALLAAVALLTGGAPNVLAQASKAAVAGVILDPDGKPAWGFKVVLRDVASQKTFTSDPTDPQGNYSVQVPVGGRYMIDHVVASDGVTELPVQESAPVSVLTAGTTPLNVRFTNRPGTTPATAATAHDDKKKAAAKPWYKRPGPIVGIVLGSALVVALVAGGSGGSNSPPPASPSAPSR
jgi:hypothetical protein